MNLNKQFHETLSQACYHLDVGDFEKVEDLLNEVSTELLKQKDNDLIIQYYRIKIDLYRSTRRREQCIQLWDEMEQYCHTPMHKCIRLSGKALELLKLNRNEEAIDSAKEALKEAVGLSEENKILALQVKGQVYSRNKEYENAIKMYATIAAIAEKDNNQAFIALNHAKIAKMLNELGYPMLALDRLFEAEERTREVGNIDLIQRIAIWRADIYRELGEHKKALDLLKIIAKLNDEHI